MDASRADGTALVPVRAPTLARCVAAWNGALLGTGRALDRVVAKYDAALMFVSRDHVCGLAFPTFVVQSAGGGLGPYFTALDGDYEWLSDPLSGPGSSVNVASLEARASRQTNIRVDSRTGRVIADRGAMLATSDSIVMDTKTPCSVVLLAPWLSRWRVLSRTVSCVCVRTLLWTWVERQPTVRLTHLPAVRTLRILSWGCVGSDRQPLGPGGTPVFRRVRCSSGQQAVEAAQ